jgi:phage FluMu protein Com
MQGFQSRRSCRVALSVPIRVIGIDYRGMDFTEEASTIIVNLHGAKIRLVHQLMPDSEIRMLSIPTGQDSLFRVVSKLQSPELKFTYWGVESMEPGKNIWGVEIPALRPGFQIKTAVMMECPKCSKRESIFTEETLLATLEEKGGMERTCPACKNLGLWKLLPFSGASKSTN